MSVSLSYCCQCILPIFSFFSISAPPLLTLTNQHHPADDKSSDPNNSGYMIMSSTKRPLHKECYENLPKDLPPCKYAVATCYTHRPVFFGFNSKSNNTLPNGVYFIINQSSNSFIRNQYIKLVEGFIE